MYVVAIENYLNGHGDVLEKIRKDRIEKKIEDGKISGKIGRFNTLRDSRDVLDLTLKKLPKESVSDDISFWIDKNSGEVLSHDSVCNCWNRID